MRVGADHVAQSHERVESALRGAQVRSAERQLAQGGEDSSVEVVGAHEDEATGVPAARPRELQSETSREATVEVPR